MSDTERNLAQRSRTTGFTFRDVVLALTSRDEQLQQELRGVRAEIAALHSRLAPEPAEPPPDFVPLPSPVLSQPAEQPSSPAPIAEQSLTPGVVVGVEPTTKRERAPRIVRVGTIRSQPTFHHSRKQNLLIAELPILLQADEQSPPREVTAVLYGPKAERLRGQELAGKAAKLIGGIAKEREVLNPDGTKQTRVEINGYALATQ